MVATNNSGATSSGQSRYQVLLTFACAPENGGMADIRLSDEEWGTMQEFLRHESRAYVGRDEDARRRFVEAVKWMSRSGAQWRLLPMEYGA